ncbi:glycosyltransferase family 2 protein [Muriicola sp. Z0-33]|uniref:glycosyltransferase family 2 protein n=1 Tax=Muriicola sp. Z0-33 TaxID=2816957 RepID=UPI002237FF56|nr:glycosyltransferase family 2 protein [Muriicola sp. Z0-33]MCW5516903.1 glycosyltransferase family 2 protein [Muriicola sp. Z0-33]
MKVSVIIPAFNCGQYIERCVNSVINQSYRDIEIIVVNDGSTDDTLSILESISQSDNRLSFISQKNTGTHLARMNGVRSSTGDVIFNLDADDYLESNAIELLVNKMQRTSADIVIGNYYQHRNGIKRLMRNTPPSSYDRTEAISFMLLGKISNYLWGRLIKRHLMDEIDLPSKRVYSEDVLTNFFILCNHDVKIEFVEEPVLNYIIHTTNISYSKSEGPVEGFFDEFEMVEKMLSDKGLNSVLQDEIALYKSLMWIGYCRKGGLKARDKLYHKEFFKKNYPNAKKHLPLHFKLEMFLYYKNIWLGKNFTDLMFRIYGFLVKTGIIRTS